MPGNGSQEELVPFQVRVCLQQLNKSHKDVRQDAGGYVVTRPISEQEDIVVRSEGWKVSLQRVTTVALHYYYYYSSRFVNDNVTLTFTECRRKNGFYQSEVGERL